MYFLLWNYTQFRSTFVFEVEILNYNVNQEDLLSFNTHLKINNTR